MKEFDHVVRLVAVKARGTGNDGDVAFLDIDDGNDRTIRLVVHYLVLPHLMAALEAAELDLVKNRRASGKQIGPPVAFAKTVDQALLQVANDIGSVVIRLTHPNGTTTNLALTPSKIDDLIDRLNEAKIGLKPPPSPS